MQVSILFFDRTVLIDGKFSIYYPYSMENFPPIVILQPKKWKNSPWFFHVFLLFLNIMENKPKFKPNERDPSSDGQK